MKIHRIKQTEICFINAYGLIIRPFVVNESSGYSKTFSKASQYVDDVYDKIFRKTDFIFRAFY